MGEFKAANILIANNPHEFDKKLFSELGYGEPIKVIGCRMKSMNQSEWWQRSFLINLWNAPAIKITQFYTVVTTKRVFEKALMTPIPYKISGGMSFLSLRN